MNRMFVRAAGIALAAVIMLPGVTRAADLPPYTPPIKSPVYAPAFDWSGFYAGVNAGWAWGSSRYTGAGGTAGRFGIDGPMIGGTLGVNWQTGETVIGVETDLDWTNIRGRGACAVAGTCVTRNSWLGTTRARLGWAANGYMPYITGGIAYGNIRAAVPGGINATRLGWTLGAGVEVGLSGNWSAKAEYLYVDLGKAACGVPCGGPGSTVDLRTHILRTGVNYRF